MKMHSTIFSMNTVEMVSQVIGFVFGQHKLHYHQRGCQVVDLPHSVCFWVTIISVGEQFQKEACRIQRASTRQSSPASGQLGQISTTICRTRLRSSHICEYIQTC